MMIGQEKVQTSLTPTETLNVGGAIIFGIATLFAFALTLAALYETYALATGNVTITAVTRGVIGHHHLIAFALTAAVLILIGHFWR